MCKKMARNINILWKTISVVFHPLVVPLYFVLWSNAVDFNASNKLIYNGYAMISKKYANLYRRYLLI